MNGKNNIDPQLKQRFDHLKNVPARDPGSAARGRARFLAEAAALHPVPARKMPPVAPRRLAWNLAAVALTLLALFYGGSVGAAFAAQDALPGEMLYPVKIASEDLRLGLARDPQTEIDLLLKFAAARVSEMNQLAARGMVPPTETAARLESQVHQALQLAAGLESDEMQEALQTIRAQLEAQEQNISQVGGETGQALQQIRRMLQEQIDVIDEGLADPEQFRNRVHATPTETHTGGESGAPTATPAPPQATKTPLGEGNGGAPTPVGSGGQQTVSPGTHTPQRTPTGSRTPPTPGGGGGGGSRP